MTNTTRRGLVLAGAALATAPITRLQAQPAGYPNKPLKIICGAAPGGLTDAYSRLFAEYFTSRTGQPCTVENRAGASGIIATDAVVKSPADGYTVLTTTTGMVWQTRVLYRKLPFDLAKDITPVTVWPSGPLVVGVLEKHGVKNLAELTEFVKGRNLVCGSYAAASYPHVFAETLNREHGGRIQTVHYKGEGPMWVEMGTGALDICVGSFQAFNTVRDKGIRPIAATGAYRSPRLPDIPTLIEQGMKAPVARLEGGLAMTAHAQVPNDILDFLARLAVENNDTPKAKALRESFAIPDMTKGRADAQRMWREDAVTWIKEVEALGVKLD